MDALEQRLGQLRHVETWVHYDTPRVFVAQTPTDQLYIAAWAIEESTHEGWLYVPVSNARMVTVRSGGLPLREAFTSPEHEVPLLFRQFHKGDTSDLQEVAPSTIPDDWLPDPEYRVDLPTPTVAPADSADVVSLRVRQERRARLRLKLEVPDIARTEAPTRRVGELLISTQGVLDNLGSVELDAIPAQRGPFSTRITDATASSVADLRAASFVIELVSAEYDDLFDSSVFGRVSSRLVDMLSVADDRESLVQLLTNIRPRAAKSFRSFVTSLSKFQGAVTIAAAATDVGYRDKELTAQEIASLQELLETVAPDETYEIRGRLRLYRADVDRRQFGLQSIDDERYEGRISDRALASVDRAEMNQIYDATITEYTSFDEIVSEPRRRFVLDQLVALGPDAEHGQAERVRIDQDGT